jgi:hypothetical protein
MDLVRERYLHGSLSTSALNPSSLLSPQQSQAISSPSPSSSSLVSSTASPASVYSKPSSPMITKLFKASSKPSIFAGSITNSKHAPFARNLVSKRANDSVAALKSSSFSSSSVSSPQRPKYVDLSEQSTSAFRSKQNNTPSNIDEIDASVAQEQHLFNSEATAAAVSVLENGLNLRKKLIKCPLCTNNEKYFVNISDHLIKIHHIIDGSIRKSILKQIKQSEYGEMMGADVSGANVSNSEGDTGDSPDTSEQASQTHIYSQKVSVDESLEDNNRNPEYVYSHSKFKKRTAKRQLQQQQHSQQLQMLTKKKFNNEASQSVNAIENSFDEFETAIAGEGSRSAHLNAETLLTNGVSQQTFIDSVYYSGMHQQVAVAVAEDIKCSNSLENDVSDTSATKVNNEAINMCACTATPSNIGASITTANTTSTASTSNNNSNNNNNSTSQDYCATNDAIYNTSISITKPTSAALYAAVSKSYELELELNNPTIEAAASNEFEQLKEKQQLLYEKISNMETNLFKTMSMLNELSESFMKQTFQLNSRLESNFNEIKMLKQLLLYGINAESAFGVTSHASNTTQSSMTRTPLHQSSIISPATSTSSTSTSLSSANTMSSSPLSILFEQLKAKNNDLAVSLIQQQHQQQQQQQQQQQIQTESFYVAAQSAQPIYSLSQFGTTQQQFSSLETITSYLNKMNYQQQQQYK